MAGIRFGAFAAPDQRVALRYSMAGMGPTETAGYVAHHLKIAGRSDSLFSDDVLALIHQVSRRLPRSVNNLAVAFVLIERGGPQLAYTCAASSGSASRR